MTLLIWAGVVSPGFGQTGKGSGPGGLIIDQAGAGVTSAKITLSGDSQPALVETSDHEGRFSFRNVTAGSYRIRVEAPGFAVYEDQLTVTEKGPANLRITLGVAELKSETEVKDDRRGLSTEAGRNRSAVILRGEAIRRLPRNEEQLLRVLQRMAGALTTRMEISVNGMPGASLPPIAAIREIRINSDPFSAAYHEPGTARVEIETRGGGETVQAGGFFSYRNSALDARNAFSGDKPPLEYRDFGGWWSSRLFNSKSFIFGSFERRRHDETSIISAYLVDGYYSDNLPLGNRQSLVNLRADFVPSDRHTISIFYDLSHGTEQGQGLSGIDLPERSYDSTANEQNLHASVRSAFSARLLNEVLFRAGRERTASTTDNFDQAVEVSGAFASGGAQCCPERRLSHSIFLADNLSSGVGRHFIKTGVSISGLRVNDYSERNFGGSFLFSGLTFYRLNRPILFTINTGDPQLRFSLWQFAGYVQDDIQLGQNFTLSPGLRYEAQTHLDDHNNFAPRLGFAWSPFQSRNTVVRGGAGLFYQQLSDAKLAEALRFDGARQRQVIILRPRYPDPLGNRPITAFPISLSRLAPDLRTPYQWHSAIGVEQQLPRDISLTLTYNFVRGTHLFRSRDANAPFENGLRPHPEAGRITQLESSSSSTSHSLAVGFSQTLGEKITVFANYTLARTIDDADGPDTLPMNNYLLGIERGYAAQDIRDQFFASAMLQLPFGLEASPMVYFNTGRPYNIITGLDDNNDTVVNDRPVGVRRNSGRGPNFASVDLRLSRQFGFGRLASGQGNEGRPFAIELSLDATNLFNHVNFADFNGIQTSPFFGRANAAHDARQITIHVNFNLH